MFTSSVKKDFTQSPYAERTRVRARAKTIGDVLVIIVRNFSFSPPLSFSLSIVLSLYFQRCIILTRFSFLRFSFLTRIPNIDRSEQKIVNVIATWRYERDAKGKQVGEFSRLSIGGYCSTVHVRRM